MNVSTILPLLKDRLGIGHNQRDTFLTAIINGVLTEIDDEKGIALSPDNNNHIMFVVDYAAYKFEHPLDDMPRNLKFRLHNLVIHNSKDGEDVS